jgi:hypothetical protein
LFRHNLHHYHYNYHLSDTTSYHHYHFSDTAGYHHHHSRRSDTTDSSNLAGY